MSDAPWRRRLRLAGLGIAAVALVASPWWGRALLSSFDFFRVRRVEVEGARYANPDEIVSRLRIDTTASVWGDVAIWERRVRQHPAVRAVRIERRLPGTLVVRVTENPPVALVQGAMGLVPFDAAGKSLPIDPSAVDVDLPVLAARDTTVLRVLGDVRTTAPTLFARIGEIRRLPRGDYLFRIAESNAAPSHDILASADISAARLSEIIPVEQDLARRDRRATELDLRFRDQIIARLP